MRNSLLTASIHIIDDDSLLNVFYLYRPFLLGEDDDDEDKLLGGKEPWDRGNWWYKLAHVCQRWRNVVLGSAAYLGVSLVCTNGTPVADMLVHSPHLPLVIDYSLGEDNDFTPEYEERSILALKQYDRVRRVRLLMPPTSLQKLVATMDDEYPILEYLIIAHTAKDLTTILMLPEILQAPHLRHLLLIGFTVSTGSRLLTNAVDLVALCLLMDHPSTYFHPNTLLRWLSFMPQLETLWISFNYPVPNRDVVRQLTHALITIPTALLNLHFFRFSGGTPYLEALVHRITAPHLEKLELELFNQLTYSVPRLLHFVDTKQNIGFQSAKFKFNNEQFIAEVYPHEDAKTYALCVVVKCCHLDWQISSATQIFNSLGPMFYSVEHFTLEHEVHRQSSEGHNEADPIEWRKLLNSFGNVKTLRIDNGLVKGLSRCLQSDGGGLLIGLQELSSESGNTGDPFMTFVGM
jgi:hypothetical protein